MKAARGSTLQLLRRMVSTPAYRLSPLPPAISRSVCAARSAPRCVRRETKVAQETEGGREGGGETMPGERTLNTGAGCSRAVLCDR